MTAETLTELVADRVGDGRGLTYRAFEEKAVDPQTGFRPGRTTLWKVRQGLDIQLTPQLVRAVAAGIGVPPERAQRAAAFQYAGYAATETGGGTAIHDPDAAPGPKVQAVFDRWSEEESGDSR